jgi:hypothetical protein
LRRRVVAFKPHEFNQIPEASIYSRFCQTCGVAKEDHDKTADERLRETMARAAQETERAQKLWRERVEPALGEQENVLMIEVGSDGVVRPWEKYSSLEPGVYEAKLERWRGRPKG